MTEQIASTILEYIKDLPPEIATMILAMIPITELRAALPIGLTVFNLSAFEAYFWSVLGNMLPVLFILWFLEPVANFLRKYSKTMDRFFIWLFSRTRHKHSKNFERWGALALVGLVAIPLPITGSWTGALAAFIFGIKYWRALFLIFLGVLIAGLIVTLISLGLMGIF